MHLCDDTLYLEHQSCSSFKITTSKFPVGTTFTKSKLTEAMRSIVERYTLKCIHGFYMGRRADKLSSVALWSVPMLDVLTARASRGLAHLRTQKIKPGLNKIEFQKYVSH